MFGFKPLILRAVVIFGFLASLPVVMAHDEVTPFPKLVQDGIPLINLASTEPDGLTVYRFVVPSGVSSIRLSTFGGIGDCDLYLRFGAHPDLEEKLYDAYSTRYTNNDSITFNNPQAGVWYVGLYAATSYSGVRLTLNTTLLPGSIPLPRFTPGSGVFGGTARVTLLSPLAGATILYTLNGSDPDLFSPVARTPVTLTSNTTLRARLRTRTGSLGPIATANYTVFPESEIQSLQSGVSVDHLCGSNTSRRYFKITVPAGNILTVQAEGGTGSTTLQVRFGAPPVTRPTTSIDTVWSGSTKVVIQNTKAGDYHILLEGRVPFTNRSLVAVTATTLPDLVAWGPTLNPYITNESFEPSSCEVQEGMITPGAHRLLRFTTESRNVGASDLVVPSPQGNPNFEYQACHGHYHFKGFASYRLLDANDNVVQLGNKVSFCLLDVVRWNNTAARTPIYTCNRQGIQDGWSDIYDSGLPGQWVVIDGVPAGNYQLEVTMNPSRILVEGDYSNNVTKIPVTIPAP